MGIEHRRSRDNAWDKIETRQHIVEEVFVNSIEGDDLLLIGVNTMKLRNGNIAAVEYVARVKIEMVAGQPKIKYCRTWNVSSLTILSENINLLLTLLPRTPQR
jgi:hypothetical protein